MNSIDKIIVRKNVKPLFVHYTNDLSIDIVKSIIEKSTGIGHIPECLRMAHMIGASFKLDLV